MNKRRATELKLEEERKIMPKISRRESISSGSSVSITHSTEATTTPTTVKVIRRKIRTQSMYQPKSVVPIDTDSIGSFVQISSDDFSVKE